jgi:hypothetical protein
MIKAVLALILVASMNGSVTVSNSNVSFRESLSSCTNALGSVSFALHHARIAAANGVFIDEDLSSENGMVRAILETSDGTKSARVTIDQTRRTVYGKHVTAAMRGKVACIHPD